jgi:hypothetical protein
VLLLLLGYLCMLLASCWLQGCFQAVLVPLGMLQDTKWQ